MSLRTRIEKLEKPLGKRQHIIFYDPALKSKKETLRDYQLPILPDDEVVFYHFSNIEKPKNSGL